MNIYLSFSRECDKVNKDQLYDYIHELYATTEAHSFWGGDYSRSELMDDMDMVLACSWDFCHPCQRVSRGVFQEVRYAMNHLGIPAYAVTAVQSLAGYCPIVKMREIHELIVKDKDAYSGTHGIFELSSVEHYLSDLIQDHLEGRGSFQDKVKKTPEMERVSPRRLFAGAKFLNLI